MREPENFRVQLELLLAATGGKMVLTVSEAAKAVGRSRYWMYDHIKFTDGTITTVELAKQLCKI